MTERLRRVALGRKAAESVLAGHPWVFPDGAEAPSLAAGEEVELVDPVGGVIGRALADGPRDGWGPLCRVLTRDPRDPPLRRLLFRRVAAARRLRERCLTPETTAYRLLHGEGDALPGLAVDRYGPVAVVRPDHRGWRRHKAAIVEALRSEGGAGLKWVRCRDKDGESEDWYGDGMPESIGVVEDGRRYWVRPGFGQKTGFFLDQRPQRSAVQRWVRPGDACLNLFAFTGGFSVAMAKSGAAKVVSVDLSPSLAQDGRDQLELNEIDPQGHPFVAADIFQWLPGHRDRYDVVVCDPPALARKQQDVQKAREAYRRLHEALAPVIAPGGLLLTCSCTARLDDEALLQDALAGLRAGGRAVGRVFFRGGAGEDHPVPPGFPEGRYLSALGLVVE